MGKGLKEHFGGAGMTNNRPNAAAADFAAKAAANPASYQHVRAALDLIREVAARHDAVEHLADAALGTFLRTLALPEGVERWSLTTLRERLVKIGAKVVSHGRYVTFQMAEVAVPRRLFAEVLWLIGRLRAPPAPA
jgi:hypothetical protein